MLRGLRAGGRGGRRALQARQFAAGGLSGLGFRRQSSLGGGENVPVVRTCPSFGPTTLREEGSSRVGFSCRLSLGCAPPIDRYFCSSSASASYYYMHERSGRMSSLGSLRQALGRPEIQTRSQPPASDGSRIMGGRKPSYPTLLATLCASIDAAEAVL